MDRKKIRYTRNSIYYTRIGLLTRPAWFAHYIDYLGTKLAIAVVRFIIDSHD